MLSCYPSTKENSKGNAMEWKKKEVALSWLATTSFVHTILQCFSFPYVQLENDSDETSKRECTKSATSAGKWIVFL